MFNASKAAFNPGKDFGPYALPKAAIVALTKQYALDYGQFGIRSNAINADRIRTALFAEDVVTERAAARGLSADDYRLGYLDSSVIPYSRIAISRFLRADVRSGLSRRAS